MRIRPVGAVVASVAVVLVPWVGAEIAAATAEAAGGAAVASADPGPQPIEPPAMPGPQRRVDVEMRDYAFEPETLDVKLGETVTFVFTNTGKVIHDAIVGDKAAQDEHERQMREAKGTGDHAGHEGAVTVRPGETAAIRHQFDRLGTFEVGCHQLGHYSAGMKMIIDVKPV